MALLTIALVKPQMQHHIHICCDIGPAGVGMLRLLVAMQTVQCMQSWVPSFGSYNWDRLKQV